MAEEINKNPVENENPYDLVDHTNSTENNATDQSKGGPGPFLRWIIRFTAKLAGLPDPETWEPAKSDLTQKSQTNTENLADQKDTPQVNTETTLEQDVIVQEKKEQQEEEKKKFSFENVMSWVSGVLDKIEKKVEEKTWLDFDAPLKKREEKKGSIEWKINDEESDTQAKSDIQAIDENSIEKNNEEYLNN